MELLNKYYVKTVAIEEEFKKRDCCPTWYNEEKERVFKGFHQPKHQEYYNLACRMLEVCYKHEKEFRFEIPKELSHLSDKNLFGKIIKTYQKVFQLIIFFGVTNTLKENCNDKIDEILTIFMLIITDLGRYLIKKGEIEN